MKINANMNIIHGTHYSETKIPVPEEKAILQLPGMHNGNRLSIHLDNNILSRGSLILGAPGTGKSNLIYHMIAQIQEKMTDRDVLIVADTKGDFYQKFYRKGDVVIGNSREYRDISARWNVFREATVDGSSSRDFLPNLREITYSFFGERIAKNTNNPFFPRAARDLSEALMATMIFANQTEPASQFLSNADLIDFINRSSRDELINLIKQFPKFKYVTEYIAKDSAQSQGVLSEMHSVINDLMSDNVFSEEGLFSIRQFVRQRGAKTLFLEYDLATGQSLAEINALLFDLALKEALGRGDHTGNVYLVADELKLLPRLHHLEDAVNFGRGLNVKIIVGLQSIKQLYEAYGGDAAESILSGFSSIYGFRVNDTASSDFIINRAGQNLCVEEFTNSQGIPVDPLRSGHAVEHWDINQLRLGNAFVFLPDKNPFRFQFAKFI